MKSDINSKQLLKVSSYDLVNYSYDPHNYTHNMMCHILIFDKIGQVTHVFTINKLMKTI